MAKRLRATFRHNVKNHKQIYPKSHVNLLISVGQLYHEGEKFKATVDLICRSNFASCTVVICDTIQHYNYMFSGLLCEADARLRASEDGRAWALRNAASLEKLSSVIQTKHQYWDDSIEHSKFPLYLNMLQEKLNADCELKEAFNYSANEYITRYKQANPLVSINEERVLDLCLQYLVEECAVIMMLWSLEHSCDFLVYPCSMLKAMAVTEQLFVNFEERYHWLSLRFKRTGSLDSLEFEAEQKIKVIS